MRYCLFSISTDDAFGPPSFLSMHFRGWCLVRILHYLFAVFVLNIFCFQFQSCLSFINYQCFVTPISEKVHGCVCRRNLLASVTGNKLILILDIPFYTMMYKRTQVHLEVCVPSNLCTISCCYFVFSNFTVHSQILVSHNLKNKSLSYIPGHQSTLMVGGMFLLW